MCARLRYTSCHDHMAHHPCLAATQRLWHRMQLTTDSAQSVCWILTQAKHAVPLHACCIIPSNCLVLFHMHLATREQVASDRWQSPTFPG